MAQKADLFQSSDEFDHGKMVCEKCCVCGVPKKNALRSMLRRIPSTWFSSVVRVFNQLLRRNSDSSKLCLRCYNATNKENQSNPESSSSTTPSESESSHEDEMSASDHEEVTTCTLSVPSVTYNKKVCFVCSADTILLKIPMKSVCRIWLEKGVIVHPENRLCVNHRDDTLNITEEAIAAVTATNETTNMKASDWSAILFGFRDACARSSSFLQFADMKSLSTDLCKASVGLTKTDFVTCVRALRTLRNSSSRSKEQALAVYLFKLRHGLSQPEVALSLGVRSSAVVGEYVQESRSAIQRDIVPLYLPARMTREELMAHNTYVCSELFDPIVDPTGNKKALYLIADGTYWFCQKSANNAAQRKNFSGQKKRHLRKPF